MCVVVGRCAGVTMFVAVLCSCRGNGLMVAEQWWKEMVVIVLMLVLVLVTLQK